MIVKRPSRAMRPYMVILPSSDQTSASILQRLSGLLVCAPLATIPGPQDLGRLIGDEPRGTEIDLGGLANLAGARVHRVRRGVGPAAGVETFDEHRESRQPFERRLRRMAGRTHPRHAQQ